MRLRQLWPPTLTPSSAATLPQLLFLLSCSYFCAAANFSKYHPARHDDRCLALPLSNARASSISFKAARDRNNMLQILQILQDNPPPVMRPWQLRPPMRVAPCVRLRSGRPFQMPARRTVTRPRCPGLVGFQYRRPAQI
jgi:hypothetical protein